jgi:hypothetical protein
MSRDIVPRSGGGELALHDGAAAPVVPSTSGLPQSRAADLTPQPVTDAQHLEIYGETLGEVLSQAGIRDPAIVGKAVAAAETLSKNAGDKDFGKLAVEFGQLLVKAGVTDVRTISAALAAGFAYLSGMDEVSQNARDDVDFVKQRKILKDLWGANFERNQAAVLSYLNDKIPPSLFDAIAGGARDMNGMRIGFSAQVMEWLRELALGPAAGGHQLKLWNVRGVGPGRDALERERAEIENVMRTDRRRYDRNASMRMRYQQILEVLGR